MTVDFKKLPIHPGDTVGVKKSCRFRFVLRRLHGNGTGTER